MKTISIIILLSFYAFSSTHVTGQVLTPEIMWEMKRVGNPEVSPNGKWSVFTVTEYSIDENSGRTNVFLIDNETRIQRQLTQCGKASSPVWAPNSIDIAFVSRRADGPAQLYVMPIDGGEARFITEMPVGVYAPKWFPNGKSIAFVANVYPDYNGDFVELKRLLKEAKDSKVSAKVTESRMYRYWDRWLTEGMYPRIFSVNLENRKVTDLMPNTSMLFGLMGGASYDISPDGNEIALSGNSTQQPYTDVNADIFLLKTDGSGTMMNITSANPASDSDPVYSPDGKFVLYGKQNRPDFYADNVQLVVYDRASKTHRNITENIDISCSNWLWSNDGKTIFFLAEDQAMQSIFSIPVAGGKHKEIYRGGTCTGLANAVDKYLIYNNNTINRPSELFRFDIKKGESIRITSFNDELLKQVQLGRVENVTYKGANDADIQMFIVYPVDFDPGKKYPLVIMIHGGPHGTFGDQWHYRWNAHLFAAPGYVAITPNFHGSTSFGQDYAISIHGNHSEKPFEDIMKATDYMIGRGFIDEERIAATGGSYGGYLVSWIAGHTDRYAALVNHAGVYDLYTQFGSDFTANREFAYGGTPWENFEKMQSHNPAMFASNFKTPMLILHGEQDFRVPIGHALTVYGIYKGMGLDARLVYYPNENHWILQPQNSIFWYKELYSWFERYLK